MKKKVIIFVHASRETNYDKGVDLGLTGYALYNFTFTGYEHALDFEVDMETGHSTLVGIDGKEFK